MHSHLHALACAQADPQPEEAHTLPGSMGKSTYLGAKPWLTTALPSCMTLGKLLNFCISVSSSVKCE